MATRDGHIRVLPLVVANKIAAGEVVERPASVVKELVENAIDAGARKVAVTVTAGGRKLIAVQDDGCGMSYDDALLAFERQATSKILDVDDIEKIDTLGFRGEAIPSIASVSRFTLTTRRRESDEGTAVTVNCGTLAEVRAAGCPPGTLVEVRDLFCNVPARRKFLRAYATEEGHVRQVFTVHALAHPSVGFSLTVDGREVYRLAPAVDVVDRVRELFGDDFAAQMLRVETTETAIRVSGFIERPCAATPTRRDQYVFVNGRPATSPAVIYALREACPRQPGDVRPAAVLFIDLPPTDVDVNVHPTKREVRFRDNAAVKRAIALAVERAFAAAPVAKSGDGVLAAAAADAALSNRGGGVLAAANAPTSFAPPHDIAPAVENQLNRGGGAPAVENQLNRGGGVLAAANAPTSFATPHDIAPATPPPAPVQVEFAVEPDSAKASPWAWFKYLATTASGYLLVETDAGVVTVNPFAARERIAFERLVAADAARPVSSQPLLIPETVKMTPPDFARVRAALPVIETMGFRLEDFGNDTWKVEAVPQLAEKLSVATVLATIARDLSDGASRRAGARWREELIAQSIARAFAGAAANLDAASATKLVEELAACRMPYVCPRGKPIMIFTSNRELNRKFARE